MSRLPDLDVAIIGAGPAGSTAARILAPHAAVTVIDPVFAGAATKPCGGLLSEAAQKSLAALDLVVPHELLVTPQCFAVRTVDLAQGVAGLYPRTYTNLDRRRFDDYLRSLIPASVRREAVRVSDVKREQGCFRLMLEDAGRLREVTCRRLIAADGGGSRVRRALYPALTANTLTAVQAHFPAGDFPAEYACYYDHRCTPACGWSLVKDDRLIVGGAFARQGASAAFAAFEAAVFRQLGRPAPARLKTEACPVVWPLKAADLLLGDDDVLFAGEAAGLISASSFEGISFALESGYAAARAILSGQPRAAAYRRAIGYLLDKHRLRRIKARLLANRRLRAWIIRSGVAQVRPKAR